MRAYRKFEQKIILDAIEEQLPHDPMVETRRKKRLGENELSDWEIKAVGRKEHNMLYIGGKVVQL